MIREIIELLQIVEDGTENIRIAKGKYKLPLSVREAHQLKMKKNKWDAKKD
jgi:hypothetical protein